MSFSKLCFVFFLLFIPFFSQCTTDDDALECYRCTHTLPAPGLCNNLLAYEVCVLEPHENSQQMILEITEKCNDTINDVSERIDFLDSFLAEQQNAGATCEEF